MEEIKNTFLRDLSLLNESEDHIEFKEAKRYRLRVRVKHERGYEARRCTSAAV